jgi:parallel beta-helix repeat protein
MRRSSFITGLALGATLGAAVISPTAAGAVTPVLADCGDTITRNAYLASDLRCEGDGLVLVGDVRLDLRGHTLRGNKTGTGIMVDGVNSDPVIVNGHIEEWGAGIRTRQLVDPEAQATFTRTVRVSRVRFAHNHIGVGTEDSKITFPATIGTTFEISRVRFVDNGLGVGGLSSGPIKISSTRFIRNQAAVSVDNGSVSITHSRFLRNAGALQCVEASCTLKHSTLLSNRSGVSLGTPFGAVVVAYNKISGSDVAFQGSAVGNLVIKANRFTGNRIAVLAMGVTGTVTRNVFTKNLVGYTTDHQGSDPTSLVTLDRNHFTKNRDGIYTVDSGTALSKNTAVKNRRWGIYAPRATDLGGNKASGNGRSPQCVGVAC